MRCFVCHAERMLTQTRVCAINPQIGREYEAKFAPPVTTPKKVLVAGGGAGGMQCALTAAERGHKVTLCEKTNRLGGNLNCEENAPFKSAFPKYISVMKRRMVLAGVDIKLNTEVTPEFVHSFAPDALMVAVGADPIVLPIPGIDSDKVIFATELHNRQEDIGHRVVILGGGLVGCESGVYLAQKGHHVAIVEMRDDVAVDANPRHRPALMKELSGLNVRTNLKAAAVTENGLICTDKNGSEVLIEADTVLSAAGMKSRTALVDSLRQTAPIVQIIGDCEKASNIRNASFRGYHAALDL